MLWQQRDAPQIVRDRLRKVVDDPARIRADVPDGWTPAKGPVATVVGDGTPVSSRGWTREVVRVSVYAADGPTARRLMVALDGALLAPSARSWGCSISASTGVIAVKNSLLGGWISSATYNVATNRKA